MEKPPEWCSGGFCGGERNLPAVIVPGLGGRHGKIAIINGGAAVSPSGVNMVLGTVQICNRPYVAGIGQGCAFDALQLQKQIIRAGIAVAYGGAIVKQIIGDVAQRGVTGTVVVNTVVADPGVVHPGFFILCHI